MPSTTTFVHKWGNKLNESLMSNILHYNIYANEIKKKKKSGDNIYTWN